MSTGCAETTPTHGKDDANDGTSRLYAQLHYFLNLYFLSDIIQGSHSKPNVKFPDFFLT